MEVFPTLCGYNLARGLAIHTTFDDLDLISRSHICQNHKLLIDFRFLSTVVYFNGAWLVHTLKRPSTVCFM